MSLPRLAKALAASLPLLWAGCAVGPNFETPGAPRAATDRPYTAAPLPAQTASAPGIGGAAQRFGARADIPSLWWALFESEPLDRLIRSALERSPTLASAQAALRQAQETYNAQSGNLRYPSVGGQLGATRERAQVSGPTTSVFSLYNASVNVSYTVDAFGSTRRELEALQSAVDYQRYQVEAAYLALTANLVTAAIQEASLRAQLKATLDVLALQEKSLGVIRKQVEIGAVARGIVLTQSTQVAQTRALIAPLEKALAQTRHQLAVYAGLLPSQASDLPTFDIESLKLPVDLPVSLPSDLVRQRPDIQASEALLHQASAQVGVATANLYPQIKLSASYGTAATRVEDLFSGPAVLWSIGAGLTQPIFNGGALNAQRRAAIAAYEQAAAQYQQTVLGAFLNVANTLRALDSDAQALVSQAEAESLAKQQLDLTNRQYQLGAISFLTLLDAQRTYQQTRVSLVQAQAARYADSAALFQSLGGGWWNRTDLPDARIELTTTAGEPLPTPAR